VALADRAANALDNVGRMHFGGTKTGAWLSFLIVQRAIRRRGNLPFMVVNDEKNRGDLKKIPAESQLTIRYHGEKTDMLVAGCYRGFLNNISALSLITLGESLRPGRLIFN